MNIGTSLYLDFLRALAGIGLFLVYANLTWFSNIKFLPAELSPKPVMIFFVFSGYLIAYFTLGKEKTLKQYSIDHLSMVYFMYILLLRISTKKQSMMINAFVLT